MKSENTAIVVTPPSVLTGNTQFKSFSASIDYGLIIGDKRGLIVDFNQAALDIFGYTDEELRGQPITKIMPERFRVGHHANIERYKTSQGSKVLRLYGLHKNGKEFPIEISVATWADTTGESYFTASMRKYSRLENNLSIILWSAAGMSLVMLGVLIYLVSKLIYG